jgi:hypothetical protein
MEVLVSQAGSDNLFVFDFTPTANIAFPALPESQPQSGATPVARALVVVVTVLPGGVPADASLAQAAQQARAEDFEGERGAEEPGAKAASTALSGVAGPERPGVVNLGGSEQEEAGEEVPIAVPPSPDPVEQLRKQRLFRRSDMDRAALPTGEQGQEDFAARVSPAAEGGLAETDRVWLNLSWPGQLPQGWSVEGAAVAVTQPARAETANAACSAEEQANDREGGGEVETDGAFVLGGLAGHALVLLGATSPRRRSLPKSQG